MDLKKEIKKVFSKNSGRKGEPKQTADVLQGDFVDDMYRTKFGIPKKKKKGSGNLFTDIKKFVVDEVKKDTRGIWK